MTEPREDGDQAFPVGTFKGMTLRDWFAGQAIEGLVGTCGTSDHDRIAYLAYQIADAAIKRRKESPEETASKHDESEEERMAQARELARDQEDASGPDDVV